MYVTNMTYDEEDTPKGAANRARRREALIAFLKLVTASETRHLYRYPYLLDAFQGYEDPMLEELRLGRIGDEALRSLRMLRRELIKAEVNDTSIRKEMKKALRRETDVVRKLVKRRQQGGRGGTTANVLEHLPPDVELPRDVPDTMPSQADLETPRPVVTLMRRNSLRRCILNEADIVEYITSLYNVTLRVTMFDEPLHEVMALLKRTDVMIGMHSGGWTNAFFLKPGAAGIQLYPYGWLPPSRLYLTANGTTGVPVRGNSYANIVKILGGVYGQWVNLHASLAFMRPIDWEKANAPPQEVVYNVHPQPEWVHPVNQHPTNNWIYQNTLVDMESFSGIIDAVFAVRGIQRL